MAALPNQHPNELARQLSRKTKARYTDHLRERRLAPVELGSPRRAFRQLDRNNDSCLSPAELREGFTMAGRDLDDESFQMLWELAAPSGEGGVTVDDFNALCALMTTWEHVAALRVEMGVSGAPAPAPVASQRRLDTREQATGKVSPGSMTRGGSDLEKVLSAGTRKNYENQMVKAGVILSPDVTAAGSVDISFNQLDVNHNDVLSEWELRAGFVANGTAVDDETFEVLWELADQDGDGKISRMEYGQLCALAHTWAETAELQKQAMAKKEAKAEKLQRILEKHRAAKRAAQLG